MSYQTTVVILRLKVSFKYHYSDLNDIIQQKIITVCYHPNDLVTKGNLSFMKEKLWQKNVWM